MIFSSLVSFDLINQSISKSRYEKVLKIASNYDMEVFSKSLKEVEELEKEKDIKNYATTLEYGSSSINNILSTNLREYNNKIINNKGEKLIYGHFPKNINEVIINENLYNFLGKGILGNYINLCINNEYSNNDAIKLKVVGVIKVKEILNNTKNAFTDVSYVKLGPKIKEKYKNSSKYVTSIEFKNRYRSLDRREEEISNKLNNKSIEVILNNSLIESNKLFNDSLKLKDSDNRNNKKIIYILMISLVFIINVYLISYIIKI